MLPAIPALAGGAAMRELGIIEDGAVLISDGKIVAVGTTDEVARHELAREGRGNRLLRQGRTAGLR